MIKNIILISFLTLAFGNTVAHAFCTCWDSGLAPAATPEKDSPGSHCGGGLDWDTGKLSHQTCKSFCAKLWPGYTWAYVDQIALNKCKAQNPSKVILPTQDQKELVEKVFMCEVKYGFAFALSSIFTVGAGAVVGLHGLTCPELLKKLQ